MRRDGKSGKDLLRNPAFAQYTPTPAQKRRMNSLRNLGRMLAREIQSATPAGPNQTLAIRHVEDALMRAHKGHFGRCAGHGGAIVDRLLRPRGLGKLCPQDGVLFREETGGTYTPVGRVRA